MSLRSFVLARLHKAAARVARDLHGRWYGSLRPPGGDVVTYTSGGELQALYDLASRCPRGSVALEIGSHLGASALALAGGLARVDGRLVCVDTWDNRTMPEGTRDTFAEFQHNTRAFATRITAVRKPSTELDEGDLPGPIALVFLDGDHSYDATRADFDRTAPWLAPGGTVAFHDFGTSYFPGVTRVVGEALASGEWIMTGLVERLACLQRARWTDPPWLGPRPATAPGAR